MASKLNHSSTDLVSLGYGIWLEQQIINQHHPTTLLFKEDVVSNGCSPGTTRKITSLRMSQSCMGYRAELDHLESNFHTCLYFLLRAMKSLVL
jgi:hypothetical protein